MEYNKEEFIYNLTKIQSIRDSIIDLYDNALYEPAWNDDTISEFEKYLEEYNVLLSNIKNVIPTLNYRSDEGKKKFLKVFEETLVADNKVFNLVKIRHEAYIIYRTNRKSLITQLNNVIGFVKKKHKKNNIEVFNYFNDKCAKVPLYKNANTAGHISYANEEVLSKWLKQANPVNITEEINQSVRTESIYDIREVYAIFNAYVKCRKYVFAIFNMITSTSEINGYDKWHTILDDYCQADLNDKQLEKLYNAVNAEDDFIPSDDYQQIMDDRTWNAKGIYESSLNESWFDDDIRVYNDNIKKKNKDLISKINMLSGDANVCKVKTNGKGVFAAVTFYPGDIVEICPTRNIDKHSLYSKDMREMVFEVVANQEWVLPFGYCQYYDLCNNDLTANCCFIWDPVQRVIVIRATDKIVKNQRLVLNNVNTVTAE